MTHITAQINHEVHRPDGAVTVFEAAARFGPHVSDAVGNFLLFKANDYHTVVVGFIPAEEVHEAHVRAYHEGASTLRFGIDLMFANGEGYNGRLDVEITRQPAGHYTAEVSAST